MNKKINRRHVLRNMRPWLSVQSQINQLKDDLKIKDWQGGEFTITSPARIITLRQVDGDLFELVIDD